MSKNKQSKSQNNIKQEKWEYVSYGWYYNEQGEFKCGPYTNGQVGYIEKNGFPVIKETPAPSYITWCFGSG